MYKRQDGGPAPWVPERALAAVARAHRSARFGDGATEARGAASAAACEPKRPSPAPGPGEAAEAADMAQFMGGLNKLLGTSNVQQFL